MTLATVCIEALPFVRGEVLLHVGACKRDEHTAMGQPSHRDSWDRIFVLGLILSDPPNATAQARVFFGILHYIQLVLRLHSIPDSLRKLLRS